MVEILISNVLAKIANDTCETASSRENSSAARATGDELLEITFQISSSLQLDWI